MARVVVRYSSKLSIFSIITRLPFCILPLRLHISSPVYDNSEVSLPTLKTYSQPASHLKMWVRKTRRNRKDPASADSSEEQHPAFRHHGYWIWSEVDNDYYHRRKNGTSKWANNPNKKPSEAQAYADLSRQADSKGIAKGVRISFSKAPSSLALLNRRISPGFSNNWPSFSNPRIAGAYKVSFSPRLGTSIPGVTLGYVDNRNHDDANCELEAYPLSWSERGRNANAKAVVGGRIPISRVSLSKGRVKGEVSLHPPLRDIRVK